MALRRENKKQVLLMQSLRGYGKPGAKVSVASGFARHFLIPRGIAVYATEANIKKLEEDKKTLDIKDSAQIEEAIKQKQEIDGKSLDFFCQVRENNNIYGSIQSRDIEQALHLAGFTYITRSQIILTSPLKALGEYNVSLQLYGDVDASINVIIKSSADKVAA